jgi:periplasmic protein TonB
VRRVRQTSPGLSQGIFSRMSAAVALSTALHVFLIYGFSLAPDAGPGARETAIQARLMSPHPPRSPQRARPPERIGAREPPPAPAVLSQPAATASGKPSTVPPPTTVPIDPEPEAPAGSDATVASIPDPVHYPAKDLDIYPRALRPIVPVYPETARDAQVAGSVTLLVLIDEIGRVVDTSVTDSMPEGVFEQAAQQALANAAFYPAQKDGRMVRSRVLIKVEFDPELTAAAQ